MGNGLMGVPEGSRIVHRSPRLFCGPSAWFSGPSRPPWRWYWGLALLLPDGLAVRLLGPSWQPASELLVPVTLAMAMTGLWVGAWTGLRALGVARRSLRAAAFGSAAYLAAALPGAWLASAAGAAWGGAAETAVATVVWWWQLHRGLREFTSSAAPAAEAEAVHLPGPGG